MHNPAHPDDPELRLWFRKFPTRASMRLARAAALLLRFGSPQRRSHGVFQCPPWMDLNSRLAAFNVALSLLPMRAANACAVASNDASVHTLLARPMLTAVAAPMLSPTNKISNAALALVA